MLKLQRGHQLSTSQLSPSLQPKKITMKEGLEAKALRQFDALVEKGDVIYSHRDPVHVPAKPFNIQFRIASSLTKKPQIPIKDAEKKPPVNKASPFANDPPEFVIEHVGPDHTLRLNKFCVVRTQFILHCNDFKPQIEPLEAVDLAAGWSVLTRMESEYLLIYNGGLQGGWSLPHRHMQLLPRPPRDVHNLFPDIYGIENGRVPNIPFQHVVRRLPAFATAEEVYETYTDLLAAAGVDENDYSHNLVLVKDWMMIIPRSRASQEGIKIVNAAAMVGMIWIPSDEVLDLWLQSGNPMETLARYGKPW
ncbi:hypothetical protein H112_07995 [Trichophyton rubrum D6]|nr:uncharacterized protein TERG_00582 [Trichophyton rubrum CBS 118892]EZF10791.1 hypothetical protein H100_08023 [Trichophyton rubrum MR850]EZF37686.1 hypothetical protein H102_07981 [Trichophyton rubrum CBS 100081]EZF48366.1 hypothetical protein H103_08006 [Trichophyton rubrum CBS 288.86]EZF58957.1 hypothetical protein H104_07954 [Trichophyton rubrum CBS 289.86]EZF69555.1 hypothetical protein H105_08006 [Trichophyton soudanense CBS 452.61]EZF80245.1 hypothetical protein H110_08006 [Trichophy